MWRLSSKRRPRYWDLFHVHTHGLTWYIVYVFTDTRTNMFNPDTHITDHAKHVITGMQSSPKCKNGITQQRATQSIYTQHKHSAGLPSKGGLDLLARTQVTYGHNQVSYRTIAALFWPYAGLSVGFYRYDLGDGKCLCLVA